MVPICLQGSAINPQLATCHMPGPGGDGWVCVGSRDQMQRPSVHLNKGSASTCVTLHWKALKRISRHLELGDIHCGRNFFSVEWKNILESTSLDCESVNVCSSGLCGHHADTFLTIYNLSQFAFITYTVTCTLNKQIKVSSSCLACWEGSSYWASAVWSLPKYSCAGQQALEGNI